jgi:hypothetical protein
MFSFRTLHRQRFRDLIVILTDHVETPIGPMLLIVEDNAVIGLEFDDGTERYMKDLRHRFGDFVMRKKPIVAATRQASFSGHGWLLNHEGVSIRNERVARQSDLFDR